MRKHAIFCLCLLLLISCKSKENSSKDNDADGNFATANDLKVIRGKVADERGKSIAYVAVKLYLDEDDCMNAYTGDDGSFEFKLDELRIKDQSHFEVVFQGYTINFLSLRDFDENKPIVLNKKGALVPVVDYNVFYESIKSCGRK